MPDWTELAASSSGTGSRLVCSRAALSLLVAYSAASSARCGARWLTVSAGSRARVQSRARGCPPAACTSSACRALLSSGSQRSQAWCGEVPSIMARAPWQAKADQAPTVRGKRSMPARVHVARTSLSGVLSEAIRSNQKQSEAIRSNPKQSEAIRSNHRSNQKQSEAPR